MKQTINIPKNIKDIMQKLIDNKFDAYIIGGAVRDNIMGRVPHDYDIFTNATGEQILMIFPEGNVIGGQQRQEKILTVIVNGIEISQFRKNGDRTEVGNNLYDHLSTCDFTINSIACDINGKLIDPHNGVNDIEEKQLRWVGDGHKRATEDPLRILRGIRFASKYNMVILEGFEVFLNFKNYINKLPKERIRDEFFKILDTENGINLLLDFRILEYIIPKFKECIAFNGGDNHNEEVHIHLIESFNNAKRVSNNKLIWIAALLHDIAKPETASCISEEDGEKIHFYQHEYIGARYVEKWMNEYKFSVDEIKFVVCLIKNHMRCYTHNKNIRKRGYISLFNELNKNNVSIWDFVTLNYCDNQANFKKQRFAIKEYFENHIFLNTYFEFKYSKEPFSISDLCVKGQDILDKGVKPGPYVGEVLKKIYDEVLDGNIKNDKPTLMSYMNDLVMEKEE
jgi:tRNA nucleotidyltransferase (CCA-adding enzyme)